MVVTVRIFWAVLGQHLQLVLHLQSFFPPPVLYFSLTLVDTKKAFMR